MTEDRTLLETLDRVVRSEEVRAPLEPIIARVRADLAHKPGARRQRRPNGTRTVIGE